MSADPRLILREEELDQGLELMLIAQASLWGEVDLGLEGAPGVGRSHWRAMFLIRRRPAMGVLDLAALSGLSKQAASKTLAELVKAGLATLEKGDLDARRRGAALTAAGAALEAKVTDRLRARMAGAYRAIGGEGVLATRRLLAMLAGGRLAAGRREG